MKLKKAVLCLLTGVLMLCSSILVSAAETKCDENAANSTIAVTFSNLPPEFLTVDEVHFQMDEENNSMPPTLISARGPQAPSSSSLRSLAAPYNFTFGSANSRVYSNFMFTNHNGRVSITITENVGPSSGGYLVRLYNSSGTQIGSASGSNGTTRTMTFTVSANTPVYFSIERSGLLSIVFGIGGSGTISR